MTELDRFCRTLLNMIVLPHVQVVCTTEYGDRDYFQAQIYVAGYLNPYSHKIVNQ